MIRYLPCLAMLWRRWRHNCASGSIYWLSDEQLELFVSQWGQRRLRHELEGRRRRSAP